MNDFHQVIGFAGCVGSEYTNHEKWRQMKNAKCTFAKAGTSEDEKCQLHKVASTGRSMQPFEKMTVTSSITHQVVKRHLKQP